MYKPHTIEQYKVYRFLEEKSVGGAYFKPGRFTEKQCDLYAMAVYQMYFAVAAEHRCTDTGADAFHYFVVLMCRSHPDSSTGYKTGAEYDNSQCQQDMIFSRHADDGADSRTGDSGQQSEQKLSLQYSGKKSPLFHHAHTLSKIICCRR